MPALSTTLPRPDSPAAWLARTLPMALLAGTAGGLLAGGLAWLAGDKQAGKAICFAVGWAGAIDALCAMIDSLRHRRLGVAVIALLAVAGALASVSRRARPG